MAKYPEQEETEQSSNASASLDRPEVSSPGQSYRSLDNPTFAQLGTAFMELPLLPFRPLWYIRRWCGFKALTYIAILVLISGLPGGFLSLTNIGDMSASWHLFDQWSWLYVLVGLCWSWVAGGATFVIGSLFFILFLRLCGAKSNQKGAAARAYLMLIFIASLPAIAWVALSFLRFPSPEHAVEHIDEVMPFSIATGIYSTLVGFLVATRVFGAGLKRAVIFFLIFPFLGQWLLFTPSGNAVIMRGAEALDSMILGTAAPADTTSDYTIDRVKFSAPSNWKFHPLPERGHPWSSIGAVAEQNQLTMYALRYHMSDAGIGQALLSLERTFMRGAVRYSRLYQPETRDDGWHHVTASYIPFRDAPEHTLAFWISPTDLRSTFKVVVVLRLASDDTEIQHGVDVILDSMEILARN